jgi:hypothetical protein
VFVKLYFKIGFFGAIMMVLAQVHNLASHKTSLIMQPFSTLESLYYIAERAHPSTCDMLTIKVVLEQYTIDFIVLNIGEPNM